jgi:cytochrome c oxidase subunit 1
MPRRIPDYPDAYAGFNKVASFGSLIILASVVLFLYIVYRTLTDGVVCPKNPWNLDGVDANKPQSPTLEWVIPSPPEFHSHAEPPLVKETI